MKRSGFTLIELLMVVAIIAVLVGAAMPFFENYVRDTKSAKARHELDILKEAMIKFETVEEKRFVGTNTAPLIGRYTQEIVNDPWGRPYIIDPDRGLIMSQGQDITLTTDDIVMDYKAPLVLQKATWIDSDNSQSVNASDGIWLQFTRPMKEIQDSLIFSNVPGAPADLLFSPDVNVDNLTATSTLASVTTLLIQVLPNSASPTFFPGSSTVRIATGNQRIRDCSPSLFGGISGRPANGTAGQPPGLEVVIRAN